VAHRLLRTGVMKLVAAALLALCLGLTACGGSGDPEPSGADASVGGDVDGGDLLPFMSDCTSSDQCDTGLCYSFNMGAMLCTHDCVTDDDCEAPSPGCNGMGVCKRPQ